MSCVFYHIKENNANHIYRRKTEDYMFLTMLEFSHSFFRIKLGSINLKIAAIVNVKNINNILDT